MARITEKEVHQAAAELDAQGIKPTTSKIREKLGSGSFSTIQNFLATYEQIPGEETPEAPEELADLLPAIWAKCWDIAQDKFDGERKRFEANCAEYEKELSTLKKIIEDQDSEIERLESEVEKEKKCKEIHYKHEEQWKEKAAYLKGKLDALESVEKKKTAKKPVKPMNQVDIEDDLGKGQKDQEEANAA